MLAFIHMEKNIYAVYIKPILGFSWSLLAILILSPLLIVLAAVLSVANKGKVFFFQKRTGKYGIYFTIVKFKTMNDRKDKKGNLLPDNERLTFIGKIIRNTSMDELPQLFNVLKGEMSLIGPRPLLPEYLPLYTPEQLRRHDIKPGITGWAQINGRNAISWEEKFRYDVWYADHISASLDLRIVLMTIGKILKREGVNAGAQVTMDRFRGTKK